MNRIPRREVEDFTDRDLQEIYAQVEELDVVVETITLGSLTLGLTNEAANQRDLVGG